MDAVEQYKAYVRENPQQVKRGEELGRLATMMMPLSPLGQYAEIFNESVYSVFGLLGAFHDHILHGARVSKVNMTNLPLRIFLTLLSQTEVTMELCTRQLGSQSRRDAFITYLEVLKAVVRVILLAGIPKGHILMSGGQYDPKPKQKPTDEAAESSSEAKSAEEEAAPAMEQKEKNEEAPPMWVGKRSGKTILLKEELRAMDNTHEVTPVAQPSSSTVAKDTAEATALDREAENVLRLTGEAVFILRPVVYLALALRAKKSQWHPWVISLVMDLASGYLVNVATSPKVAASSCTTLYECMVDKLAKGAARPADSDEAKAVVDELRRRRTLLFFYVMRNPFFDKYTLQLARSLGGAIEKVPGIGSLGKMIEETLNYYQQLHFYISAS